MLKRTQWNSVIWAIPRNTVSLTYILPGVFGYDMLINSEGILGPLIVLGAGNFFNNFLCGHIGNSFCSVKSRN